MGHGRLGGRGAQRSGDLISVHARHADVQEHPFEIEPIRRPRFPRRCMPMRLHVHPRPQLRQKSRGV